ncbi:MAG: BrnA antitoxin family protein [Methylococcales bacterium]|nr:BrnA antitoxin family protein [Methylococcales bacterium]
MNKNFISPMSDDFDEFPEISQADLNNSIRRRNFAHIEKKQNVNLALDADVIVWFKQKSGDEGFQSLINATLREAIVRKNGEW